MRLLAAHNCGCTSQSRKDEGRFIADLQVAIDLVGKDSASGVIGAVEHQIGALNGTVGKSSEALGQHATATGKAEQAMGSMNETAAKSEGVLGRIAGMAANGFGLMVGAQAFQAVQGAFDKAVTSATEFGASALKLQREIGGTAEQATGLLAVFERYGVSSDQASVSLGIFSKHLLGIEDAADGGQKVGKSFAQTMSDLGVKFLGASGDALPMNDILLKVADRFKEMPDGVDKTALAMQLFGRSGKDMILVLNQGSEGIQEAMDAAQKYGLVLSGANLDSVRKFGLAHKDLDEALQGLTLQLGIAFMPLMTRLADLVAQGAQALNTTLVPAITELADKLSGPAQTALDDFGMAFDVVRAVWEAFTGDAGAIGVVYDVIRKVFGDTVGDYLQPFLQWFMDAIPSIVQFVSDVVANFSHMGDVLGDLLRGNVRSAFEDFLAYLGGVLGIIGPILLSWGQAFVDWVRPAIPPMLTALGELLGQMDDWIGGTAAPAIGTALLTWSEAFGAWVAPQIGPTLVSLGQMQIAIVQWIIARNVDILGALAGWAAAFVDWIPNALAAMIGALADVTVAFLGWITDTANGTNAATNDEFKASLINWIPGAIDALGTALQTVTQAFLAWITSAATEIGKGFQIVEDAIVAAVEKIAPAASTAAQAVGTAIIHGVVSGVTGGVGALSNAVSTAAQNALDAAKSRLGIQSPSQVFADEVGVPIVQGVIEGIESQAPALSDALSSTFAGALTRNTDLTDIIKQTAAKYGIDASTAIRVAMSEGGVTPGAVGDKGSSFGPFQLHVGGVARGGNAVSGMGDSFKAMTGLDPTDIQTTIQQIDFALSNAAAHGWSAWHGAAAAGISDWQGIGGQAKATATDVAAAQDTVSNAVEASMQSFGEHVQTEIQGVTNKLADIQTKASDTIAGALDTETKAIDTANLNAQDAIARLNSNFSLSGVISQRRSDLQTIVTDEERAHAQIAAAAEADYQHKLALSQAEVKFHREMQDAKTDKERAAIQKRYDDTVATINQQYADAQVAVAHRQALDEADRIFKKAEDDKVRKLDQDLAKEALDRQIADLNTNRDKAIATSQETYDDAVKKAQLTADTSRAILLRSFTQRIDDLKTQLLDKLPPLTDEAQSVIDDFLANVDSEVTKTTSSIVSQTSTAVTSVDALTSSINAIPDHTVTITTNFVTTNAGGGPITNTIASGVVGDPTGSGAIGGIGSSGPQADTSPSSPFPSSTIGSSGPGGRYNNPQTGQPYTHASGGVTTGPVGGIFGEAGPEAIIPLGDYFVSHKSESGAGSRLTREDARLIAEELVNAMNKNGSFSVGVDQIHSALIQKARRSGSLKLT